MALDSVKMEITKSADASAAAIRAEADEEIKKIMSDAEAQIAIIEENEKKRLEEAIERLGRQELSSAELESKKIILAKKKEILEKAFAGALASLEATPASEKLAQYKQMVESTKSVFKKPKAYLAPGDKFTAEDLGVSSIAVDERITGGIILEDEDGDVQVDMQYKTILQTIWDREIKSLSDILFG